MSYEAWPSPDAPRGPLPRIEDLPISEQGYDQEAVREAFDAFYRHAAQLDASLRALESVEVFRREAAELRADLRSVRALGFGGEPGWAAPSYGYGYAYERPPREFPAGVLRIAAEAALVIAVAVIAGIAQFRAWVIVMVMAAAWAIVALSEWLAARARYRVPESLYDVPVEEDAPAAQPAEVEAPEPVGWTALEPEPEEPRPHEQTIIEPAAEAEPDPEAALAVDVKAEEPAAAEAEAEEPAAAQAEEEVDAPPAEEEVEEDPAAEAEPEIVAASEPEPAPEAPVRVSGAVEGVSGEPGGSPEGQAEQPRRRWFRRGVQEQAVEEPVAVPEREPEPVADAAPPPSHVRVLPAVDPWERGFDGDDEPAEPEFADPGRVGRVRRRRR